MLHLNLPQSSVFNRFQSTVRFSQSELLPICQMEQLLLARTKKEFIYIGFPAQSSNFSCQTLGDCLCTPDAFHISNSIRYFWASVWVRVRACHLNRCKTSYYCRGPLGNIAASGQRRRCNVPLKTYLHYINTNINININKYILYICILYI